MTLNILIGIGIVMLGLTAYLHYIINKLQDEVKAVWLQIAVLAAATAKQFTKIEEENKKENGK